MNSRGESPAPDDVDEHVEGPLRAEHVEPDLGGDGRPRGRAARGRRARIASNSSRGPRSAASAAFCEIADGHDTSGSWSLRSIAASSGGAAQ